MTTETVTTDVVVSESYGKKATGVSWSQVVKAMDFSNVGTYIQEEVDAYLAEQELTDVPHIFMATHSCGGRSWKTVEDAKPAYFSEECFNGGWYIFREEDVEYLWCSSATSGSELEARRQDDGTWTLWVTVPISDGKRYEGSYWGAFHSALGLESPTDQ